MLQLATAHAATFDVVTVEVERLSPTYTVDTLEWFRQQQAAAELFFILGQDALADLPAWQHSEHILALASLAVAPRLPGQRSVERLAAVLPGPAERVISLLMPQMEISASEIRKRVKAGLQIRHLVPEGVERYIREKGLYR